MNQITINHWCKQCGLCADFCPKKVFDYTAGPHPGHRQARGLRWLQNVPVALPGFRH